MHRSKLFPLLGAAAWLFSSAAGAADSSDASSAGTYSLDEIVVTAEKRTESIRAVAQSVSVLSGEQLEEQHISDYADLATTVPGLSYSSQGGPGLSTLEIRGISSSIGESTVSIYLDDAPITIRNNSFYAGQPEPQLFDLARAEVLRGPQGTLYGASAMGGTIKLESNPVNLEKFGGEAYQELSDTKNGGLNYVTRGILNLPLIDGTLGLRIGVQTSKDSGFVDHETDGVVDRKGVNADRTNVVKLALTYIASPDLKITLSGFGQRTSSDDTGLVDLSNPNYYISKSVPEPGQDTFAVGSLKIAADLHWADLTSVTSYADRQFRRTTDGTYFNSVFVGYFVDSILALPGLDGKLDGDKLAALPGPVYNSLTTKQWTQEIRLSSKAYDPNEGLPIAWIGGIYFSDAEYVGTSYQYIPGFSTTFQNTYGITPLQALGAATPNDLFYQFVNNLDDREFAVFGEFSYYPLSRLKVTLGAREFFGKDSETDVSSGFFASTPYDSGHLKANALTPKFSVSYDLDPSVTAYATVGKGFRLGGINSPVPVQQCGGDLAAFGLNQAPNSYQSDSVWNFEVGTKGIYFDRATSINAAIYDLEWSKIQINVPLPTCGFNFIDNLGHARSYGSEIELQQKLGRSLTLAASLQYNHDTFTQSVAGLGIDSGDIVPGSPSWSSTVSANYERKLSGSLSGFLRSDWKYIGSSHGTFVESNQDYLRPSYSLLGASIGIDSRSWSVSLFAKNILNEDKIIQSPSDNYVAEGYTPVPRILGVSGTVRF